MNIHREAQLFSSISLMRKNMGLVPTRDLVWHLPSAYQVGLEQTYKNLGGSKRGTKGPPTKSSTSETTERMPLRWLLFRASKLFQP